MSVLKAHRTESKAEFINVADKIYVETVNFLPRLSARYSRISVNGMFAYLEGYDDHKRVLRLRRIFYAIYGFSSERIENFRLAEKISKQNGESECNT